jgi:hypothetical protein
MDLQDFQWPNLIGMTVNESEKQIHTIFPDIKIILLSDNINNNISNKIGRVYVYHDINNIVTIAPTAQILSNKGKYKYKKNSCSLI